MLTVMRPHDEAAITVVGAVCLSVHRARVFDFLKTGKQAGLTNRHGTHVRRAPGWKGAAEQHAAKILSMSFSLRCHRRKFCVNFVTQKIHKRSFKRGARIATVSD